MFIRINWGKVRSGQWDAYEEAYIRVMSEIPKPGGLQGRWLARDTEDPDAGFAISLWSDEADMTSYSEGADMKDKILPALDPYFSGEFKATICEIRHAEE